MAGAGRSRVWEEQEQEAAADSYRVLPPARAFCSCHLLLLPAPVTCSSIILPLAFPLVILWSLRPRHNIVA